MAENNILVTIESYTDRKGNSVPTIALNESSQDRWTFSFSVAKARKLYKALHKDNLLLIVTDFLRQNDPAFATYEFKEPLPQRQVGIVREGERIQ